MFKSMKYQDPQAPTQPQPPSLPIKFLTPEGCISSTKLRQFLRLSRATTDDTIRPHLNELNKQQCNEYFNSVIAPAWQQRQQVISYCQDYSQQLRNQTQEDKEEITDPSLTPQELAEKFDLRTDPYAFKTHQRKLEQQYAQCDLLDNWTRNEQTVETIIREQTIGVLNDKCSYQDWMKMFKDITRSL